MSKQLNLTRAMVLALSILSASVGQANELACSLDLQQQIQKDLESAQGNPAGRMAGGASSGLTIGLAAGAVFGGATGVPPMVLFGGLVGGAGGMTIGTTVGGAASTVGMSTELKDIPLYASAQHLIELMDSNSEAHRKEASELRNKVPSLSQEAASSAIVQASTRVMNQSRCGIPLQSPLTTQNLVQQYLSILSQVLQ